MHKYLPLLLDHHIFCNLHHSSHLTPSFSDFTFLTDVLFFIFSALPFEMSYLHSSASPIPLTEDELQPFQQSFLNGHVSGAQECDMPYPLIQNAQHDS